MSPTNTFPCDLSWPLAEEPQYIVREAFSYTKYIMAVKGALWTLPEPTGWLHPPRRASRRSGIRTRLDQLQNCNPRLIRSL
jgi:hypothetical protein